MTTPPKMRRVAENDYEIGEAAPPTLSRWGGCEGREPEPSVLP